MAVSLSSTVFNSHLRSLLSEAHLTLPEIETVLRSVSAVGGTIPQGLKDIAAKAIANSVDTVFLIPLATGLGSFVVACCTEWKKIKRPGDDECGSADRERE